MDEELRSPQNLRLTSQTALIAEGYDQVPSLVEDIDKGVKMDGNRSGMNDALENMDEATRLKELTAGVRDQVELERSVAQQADRLLFEQAEERDHRRLEKANNEKSKCLNQIQALQQRLLQSNTPATTIKLKAELENLETKLPQVDNDIKEILERIEARHEDAAEKSKKELEQSGTRKLPHESQREFLIRTGKITPFSKVSDKSQRTGSTLQDVILDAEESDEDMEPEAETTSTEEPRSHQYLSQPGFSVEQGKNDTGKVERANGPSPKRRRLHKNVSAATTSDGLLNAGTRLFGSSHEDSAIYQDDVMEPQSGTPATDRQALSSEDSDAAVDDAGAEYSVGQSSVIGNTRKRRMGSQDKAKAGKPESDQSQHEDLRDVDDGNEQVYQARLKAWESKRRDARNRALSFHTPNGEAPVANGREIDGEGLVDQDVKDEWLMPHPTKPDTALEGGLHLPGDIYPLLFDYQKTGVQWLWELYQQQVGGIIGDEMGLGKTIQVISFLAGLHHSNKLTKPIIVVTPATVLKQWVNEFHRWWPPLRVSILHASGSGMLNLRSENDMEQAIEQDRRSKEGKRNRAREAADKVVKTVVSKGHVLLTTYAGLQTYGDLLIPVNWGYAVLDEGHKIRNPNTAITIYCKEIRTPNRIILSGTPMQNNLTELWSLFDFIFPMRLGTLVNFRNQFEIPIKLGGYANASNLQVQTAVKCAETLKDTISPYLLQRLKTDVASDLPKKSEQVLFCKLTKSQRQAYETYLGSDDVRCILEGELRSFAGIERLRKICNHPDLLDREILLKKADYEYGHPSKSGKMQVVRALLELWKKNGHKTLLFAQQKIVLNILEKFVKSFGQIRYRRMDGETPIVQRQTLVDEFNNSAEIDLFLLTTKVGGLGINLTGADRVIIFDPDWNPSTDTQARERAWRLGQKREVIIYRLMTAGTIEEKIYHRQLFKQFLANKILKDPKQRQAVPMRDLRDLFTLGSDKDGETETGQLFQGTEIKIGRDVTTNGHVTPAQADPQGSQPVLGSSAAEGSDDLHGITGVAGVEELVDPSEKDMTSPSGGDDARIVEGILAGSGVSSALEHDQILNGKPVIQADPVMVEREARRIAAGAAKELRKAGEAARHVPIGTPTWTGQVGVAGRPESFGRYLGAGRGGPSSGGVLAGLQARQSTPNGGASERGASDSNTSRNRRAFADKIRSFLIAHGGEARSKMLVDHFNHMCRTAQQTADFKETLTRMATLEKGGRMRGKWVLKDEYKA